MNDLIYGKRRQGKTTLALALAVARHNRVAVFDPNDQLPVITSVDATGLVEWVKRTRDLEPGIISLIRVGPFNSEEIEEQFEQFATILQSEGDISIIVDEAHMLQGSTWINPHLDRWNRRSPADVSLIQTTHRIVDAHPDSRYHADNVFFFYAYLPKELKTINDNFGSVAEVVPRLTQYQVVHWTKKSGGVPYFEVWPNGGEWFIDLENRNQNG